MQKSVRWDSDALASSIEFRAKQIPAQRRVLLEKKVNRFLLVASCEFYRHLVHRDEKTVRFRRTA